MFVPTGLNKPITRTIKHIFYLEISIVDQIEPPPPIHVYLESRHVTLLGSRVFAGISKVRVKVIMLHQAGP